MALLRCSAPLVASSHSRRRSGARRTSIEYPGLHSYKLDRPGADFQRCMDMMRTRLHAKTVAIQIPLGSDDNFRGVIDLMDQKAILFREETLGSEFEVTDIPAEFKDLVHEYRDKIIEAACEADEKLYEKFVGGEAINNDELKAALRKATIAIKV